MVDEIANSRMRPDVAAALAEPAFASLARAGAPIAIAEGEPARVIEANGAALALFSVADCDGLTQRLFGADEPATRRLAHLARTILPGAAARVERVTLGFDLLPETVTFLCRRTPGANPLFVLAGLGLRAGLARVRAPAAAEATSIAPLTAHENLPEKVAESAPANAPENTAGKIPEQVSEDSPEAGPAPDVLAALRHEMEQRFPGPQPARFLWRTDAANIVTEIAPTLAEIVGSGCASLVGRDFFAAAEALGLDPRGQLAQALRGRATFSRIEVDWPIENAAAAAPVTLGGLPTFGRAHDFEGWRGFGVVHLDRLHEAPKIVPPFVAISAPSPVSTAAAEQRPAVAPSPAAVAPEFSGVVVPLRPLVQTRPAASAEAQDEARAEAPQPAPGRDADDDSVLVSLAPHERNAFREIARTLGGRGGETTGSFVPASEPAHENADASSRLQARPLERGEPPSATKNWLDLLPVGLLVLRDGQALFASGPLLDWLGFADLAAFERSGGLLAACRNTLPEGSPEGLLSQRRPLLLRSVEGASFAVDAQRGTIVWEGAPAEIVALTRPSAAALEQRVGVLEAALRQREAEADETLAILDTAADGFVLINADGAILGLNRSAENLFGYGRNQVAGENFTLLLARESHPAALEYFARVKAGQAPPALGQKGQHGDREVVGRTRQGDAAMLHLTIGRLGKADSGKFCVVLRDFSQWKQASGAIEEAHAQAVRDSQAKSEFLAKVSHEIRTPLNAILGFAEVIMEERFGPVGNARYKDYLKDIHASGAHVMSLVNDLLDLSKVESGGLDLAPAAVDANRVIAECVSLIQPQANREKVITRLALSPRLPQVWVDERSLRQIVLNLLANAVRYNEPGGQVIVSTAFGGSGHAVLRVKDTGIGMSEKDLETALEPFRQVDPSRGGGAGLGLPLTKALAEANHAGFTIRSRKDEGTLVEITFPLAPADSAAEKAG